MYQGSKSIKDYHKDMKVALTRANVLESNEDIVELYHYASLDNLVHQAIREKVKQKRRLTLRKSYPNDPSSWKGKGKRKRGQERIKGNSIPQGQKEERMKPGPVPASKSNNIKCFKCLGKGYIALHYPKKRSMIMKEYGTIDNDSSITKSSSKRNSDASCESSLDKEEDMLMVSYVQSSLMVAIVSMLQARDWWKS
ncbi:hypothetical protein CR513_00440, partial [Mucuna pruriens]